MDPTKKLLVLEGKRGSDCNELSSPEEIFKYLIQSKSFDIYLEVFMLLEIA